MRVFQFWHWQSCAYVSVWHWQSCAYILVWHWQFWVCVLAWYLQFCAYVSVLTLTVLYPSFSPKHRHFSVTVFQPQVSCCQVNCILSQGGQVSRLRSGRWGVWPRTARATSTSSTGDSGSGTPGEVTNLAADFVWLQCERKVTVTCQGHVCIRMRLWSNGACEHVLSVCAVEKRYMWTVAFYFPQLVNFVPSARRVTFNSCFEASRGWRCYNLVKSALTWFSQSPKTKAVNPMQHCDLLFFMT